MFSLSQFRFTIPRGSSPCSRKATAKIDGRDIGLNITKAITVIIDCEADNEYQRDLVRKRGSAVEEVLKLVNL